MSVRLMVEVLDHYHGPHVRKLWLMAFADAASDDTRTGWCPRWKLAHRADVSPEHATRVAGELAREGVIKRHGGGYRGQAAMYELLPLTERVPPETPIGTGKGATTDTLSGRGKGDRPDGKGDRLDGKGATTDGKGATTATPSLNPLNIPHLPSRAPERESRAILASLGATEREIDLIIARINTDPGIRHPAAYLRTALGNGDGSELLSAIRRELNARREPAEPRLLDDDLAGWTGVEPEEPPPPPRPSWCGQCDERTRLVTLTDDDGKDWAQHCPRCHQSVGAEPANWKPPW
jgi:hypothetical protein